VGASVRQRLLTGAHQIREEFQNLLTRYAIERLLYRLSCSRYREDFILKGAIRFALWGEPHRPIRDLDVLGREKRDVRLLVQVFRDICATAAMDDGVAFDGAGIRGEEIRGGLDYPGVRILVPARIEAARVLIQVDVGFGDVIVPGPETADYPTLLEYPAPRLLVYPRDAVVAEKYQAMVVLGMANSRMKDFYDIVGQRRRSKRWCGSFGDFSCRRQRVWLTPVALRECGLREAHGLIRPDPRHPEAACPA
jgi:hypothetical protein